MEGDQSNPFGHVSPPQHQNNTGTTPEFIAALTTSKALASPGDRMLDPRPADSAARHHPKGARLMTNFVPCWPDDRDYLDGRVELRLPPERGLQASWDADILDVNGVRPGTIIAVTDAFDVRFRVELVGALWQCFCGDWCFDIGFTSIGDGTNFDLANKLPAGVLDKTGWKGCDT